MNARKEAPEPELTPAQAAWFDYRKDYGSWRKSALAHRYAGFMAGYAAAGRAEPIDFTDVPPVSTGNIEREYSRDHH